MATASPLSRRRRIGVLLICSMSLFIVGLDITAVNVALPSIGMQLDASLSWLQWTVSAYTLVMASLLLFSGSMADRLGRKRTLVIGLSVFSVASLLCSLAPTVELLVVFRVLQGDRRLDAQSGRHVDHHQHLHRPARASSSGRCLGRRVRGFDGARADRRRRARLLRRLGSIFLMNIPLGLAAIVLTVRSVPESKAPEPRRFDPVGQVLVFVLLASVTYGIIEAPNAGWTSPVILGAFGAAAIALLGLLRYEPRRKEPLIDLRFFRSIPFSSSIALSVAAFASFGGFLFLKTLYLQDVRGLAPLEAGLAIVPIALMSVILSPVSGRMVGRRGPRRPLLIAGIASFAACSMLADIGPETPFAWLIAAYVVFGIGFGFVNAPITNAAVSGMPREQAGVAAAIATTSRQFGQAIGVAIVGAIVASSAGVRAERAFVGHPSRVVGADDRGAIVLVLGLLATGRRATESARSTAVAFNPDALAA